ncbi:hypothetical protein FACS1894152_1720 [Bacilli bacterium]|nr:hypothetical protein FACS1894152_1720 [Bacilli bacterium]
MNKIISYLNDHSKVIAVIGIFLMCVSLFATSQLAYMNSDNSWYAIMGKGIANGNILLRDWIGSSLSHYFPYAVVEAFWALFINSYRAIHALSIVSLTAVFFTIVWFLLKILLKETQSLLSILSAVTIFIAIHPADMSDAYAHLAPMLITLMVVYLYYRRETFDVKSKITITALLGCWIDGYNYAYFLLPMIIENIFYCIKTKKFDTKIVWIFIGMLVFVLRHVIMKSFVIKVPGFPKSYYTTFIQYNELPGKLNRFYVCFIQLFSADFWGRKVFKAIPQIAFTVVMFFTMFLHFLYARRIVKEYDSDARNRLMLFILVSSFAVFGVDVFSTIFIHARYTVGIFVNSLILLCYWLNMEDEVHRFQTLIFLTLFALSVLYQKQQGRYRTDARLKERRRIAKILKREGLHRGYATFGNALSTNFVANETIAAPINKFFAPLQWLSNQAVYSSSKFYFVMRWISDGEWSDWDPSEEEVLDHFGNPVKTIDEGRVRIYIYDHDLSDKVQKP